MPARPVVNWILGHEAETGWAYANNFHRLSRSLTAFDHTSNSPEPADVAIYFDVLIARDYPSTSRKAIVRVGGPRPLDVVERGDPERLRRALEKFDRVIALSSALERRVSGLHSNVTLVPNGLDLSLWKPASLRSDADRLFTAGFAGSDDGVKRGTKGLDLAMEAAQHAGTPLLRCHKGSQQIAHERMIEDFYSRIDVLIHPSIAEGSSNVIMEALALGIPVITTKAAGYHGERLLDGVNALIRPPSVEDIADAVGLLRAHELLRRQISSGARLFAEQHHSISSVASSYEKVIVGALDT